MRLNSVRTFLAIALLATVPASAESESKPSQGRDRTGFVIGFAVGFGATYPCDTCPSVAGSFYVGARTTKNLAVVADIGVAGGDFDRPFDDRFSDRGLGLATFT